MPIDETDPQFQRFVHHVREDTVRKMASSAFTVTVAPPTEDDVDIKLAVETGLAILLNKPIVVIAVNGRPVPPGLARVAHAVIHAGDIDTEEGKAEVYEQLQPYLEELS